MVNAYHVSYHFISRYLIVIVLLSVTLINLNRLFLMTMIRLSNTLFVFHVLRGMARVAQNAMKRDAIFVILIPLNME